MLILQKFKYIILFLLFFMKLDFALAQKEEHVKFRNTYTLNYSMDSRLSKDSSVINGIVYEKCGDTNRIAGRIKIKETGSEFYTDIYGNYKTSLHPGTYHIALLALKGYSESGEREWSEIMDVKVKLYPQQVAKLYFYSGCSLAVDKVHP